MSEGAYVPLQQRAAWLIERGTRAWQQVQQFAIAEDELVDSLVLLGHDLWLPHHETDGALYSVTLRLAVHFPEERRQLAAERVLGYFRELESQHSDDRGALLISAETR